MKTLNIFFIAILVTLSSNLFAMTSSLDSIGMTDSNQSDLIMVRLEKSQKGSEVVVLHSNGDLVMSKVVKRRKMIIDFSEVKFGTYSIVLMKDGAELESITFKKELIISQIPR